MMKCPSRALKFLVGPYESRGGNSLASSLGTRPKIVWLSFTGLDNFARADSERAFSEVPSRHTLSESELFDCLSSRSD